MTELLELELENGETQLVEFPEAIDGQTQRRLRQQIKTKTVIKQGQEPETHIEDSLNVAIKLRDTLVKRALDRSPDDHGLDMDDLAPEGLETIVEFYKDRLENIGLTVKKKGQNSTA